MLLACAAPQPLEVHTPQGRAEKSYPQMIEASLTREQAAEDAWRFFLAEHNLPWVKPDFDPVLYTPRALPLELAGQINLHPKGRVLGEAEMKEALRQFIERWRAVVAGNYRSASLNLRDLSLISFSDEGNIYRALYQQMSYPFPIANGYGELRFVLSKTGRLLQMSSSLLPVLDLPTQAVVEVQSIIESLLGREFTYTSLTGQPLSYRVTQREEILIKDLVVYPKLEKNRLVFHLAYPVEVGRGTTWTVYLDAITGQEIEVKQNFAT